MVKNTVYAKQCLDMCYGPVYSIVKYWFHKCRSKGTQKPVMPKNFWKLSEEVDFIGITKTNVRTQSTYDTTDKLKELRIMPHPPY